jgi:hypothetical protein
MIFVTLVRDQVLYGDLAEAVRRESAERSFFVRNGVGRRRAA